MSVGNDDLRQSLGAGLTDHDGMPFNTAAARLVPAQFPMIVLS